MLRWPLGFFIVALIAAVLGFGGIAATASGIAQSIFYVFFDPVGGFAIGASPARNQALASGRSMT